MCAIDSTCNHCYTLAIEKKCTAETADELHLTTSNHIRHPDVWEDWPLHHSTDILTLLWIHAAADSNVHFMWHHRCQIYIYISDCTVDGTLPAAPAACAWPTVLAKKSYRHCASGVAVALQQTAGTALPTPPGPSTPCTPPAILALFCTLHLVLQAFTTGNISALSERSPLSFRKNSDVCNAIWFLFHQSWSNTVCISHQQSPNFPHQSQNAAQAQQKQRFNKRQSPPLNLEMLALICSQSTPNDGYRMYRWNCTKINKQLEWATFTANTKASLYTSILIYLCVCACTYL